MADIAATVGPDHARQFQSLFTVIPFSATVTLTATAGSETSQILTGIIGAAQGDLVILGIVEDTEAGSLTGQVNVTDQVELIFANATGSTITIPVLTVVKGVVLKLNPGFEF